MSFKLKFADSETASDAKEIIKKMHGFKVARTGATLLFSTEHGKNISKLTLKRWGMQGLDKQ